GSLYKDIGIVQNAIMEKSAIRGDLFAVIPDFQNALVEFGPLLVSHLACLRNLPSQVVRIPGSEVPNVTLLSTPGMFPFPEFDAPAFYRTLCPFSGSNRGDIRIRSGLENIFKRYFLLKK